MKQDRYHLDAWLDRQHVAETKSRIAHQKLILTRMKANGHSSKHAEIVLHALQGSLAELLGNHHTDREVVNQSR